MNILITGISGFVGTHLTSKLIEQGHHLVGLDHSPRLDSNIEIIQCDILSAQRVQEVFEQVQPEAIIHLAAQSNPGLSFEKPRLTFEVNLIGTLEIFEAVRRINQQNPQFNPKIVVTGSVDEYGIVPPEQLPITEQTSFHPNNPYAISKLATAHLSRQYADSYGLQVIYVSPFNQIGPNQAPGFFISDMCLQIAKIENNLQEPTIQTGNLQAKRDFVDVRDVTNAYSLLLEYGQPGTRYNICSGQSHSMSDILGQLLSMTKHHIIRQYDSTRGRPADIPDRYGSYQQLNQSTGWQPQISLTQSLQDTLNWYRQNYERFL